MNDFEKLMLEIELIKLSQIYPASYDVLSLIQRIEKILYGHLMISEND